MKLQLRNMKKSFEHQVLFEHLNFDFSKSGCYVILGESGCGKSTLLNIIAGYEPFDEGERVIDPKAKIAYIFQSYELMDHFTVEENLTIGGSLTSLGEKEIEILKILQIQDLLKRYPKELSSGQKQRVGIARALLLDPEIILCDEPTEALDDKNKEVVLKLLKVMSKTKAVIIVTHDISSLESFYDYKYILANKELSCMEQRSLGNDVIANACMDKIALSKIKYYIRKLIQKSSILFTLVLSLLLLFQFLLLQVHLEMFYAQKELSSANAYVHYVSAISKNFSNIQTEPKEILPCLPFQPLKYKEKRFSANIVPFPTNPASQVLLYGEMPKRNEILMNQNIAKDYASELGITIEELIGKEVELNYFLGQETMPMCFVISGILEETSVENEYQMYYDWAGMYEYLQSYTNKGTTLYDELMTNGSSFALSYDDTTWETSYDELKNTKGMYVFNSVLTPKEEKKTEKQFFEFIFKAVQVVLVLTTILFIIFYARKETKKHATTLSILCACGAELNILKKHYILDKILLLFSGVLLSYGIAFLINKSMFSSIVTSQVQLVMFGYAGIICFLYAGFLIESMRILKQKNITILLKEDKDLK